MFTGLVQSVGRVAQIVPQPAGLRLVVDAAAWGHRPAAGDSISVSGCCLTIASGAAAANGLLTFDVVPETLAKTTLGDWVVGSKVNLEHAVTASTLMGGHFVQGHVDGVGVVTQVQTGDDWRLTIRPPESLMPFCAPKGSICIDGVSLTLAAIDREAITVALIPTTLDQTTLRALKSGMRVNLEADMIAKTVVHYLREFAPPR